MRDLGLWNDPASAYSNVGTKTVGGNTVVDSGTVAHGTNIIDDKNFNRTDDIRAAGWKSELKLDDKWTASMDVGLSKSKRHERLIESAWVRPIPVGRQQGIFSGVIPKDVKKRVGHIRLETEFVYLAVLLDAFSRRVSPSRHCGGQ